MKTSAAGDLGQYPPFDWCRLPLYFPNILNRLQGDFFPSWMDSKEGANGQGGGGKQTDFSSACLLRELSHLLHPWDNKAHHHHWAFLWRSGN